MAGKLFGRRTRLTIRPKDADAFYIDGKSIDRDGFDISFDIDKDMETKPNKAKFTVYNLPDNVRAKLEVDDNAVIEFEAGYKTTSAIVFKGNIAHVLSALEGPDMATHIEAGEGHKAYRKSYVAKSYGAGTPFKTVVEDIVKTFEGFKVTPAITRAISNVGKSFPNGLTIDGRSARVLNDVLKHGDLEFSINNNEIQIVKTDTRASDAPTIVLDYTSGLVNVPQLGDKDGKPKIDFQSLLQPGLVPGRKVQLDWGVGKKNVVVRTVKITGSNFEDAFYCNCEAALPS